MAKQIINLSSFSSFSEERSSILLRTANTNLIREQREYKTYNPRYAHLNFEISTEYELIVPVNKKSLVSRIDECLEKQGLDSLTSGKHKRGRKIGAVIMFSASRDRMQQIAFGEKGVTFSPDGCCPKEVNTYNFRRWALEVREFVCQRYGKKNLVAFIAHLDIARPEVIAIVLAVGDGKYLSYNEVYAGGDGFEYSRRDIDLWDKLHEQVNANWGLERGERRSALYGHFYKATPFEVEMLQKIRDQLKDDIENKVKQLDILIADVSLSERREKGLTTMLSNLEVKKSEIESEISSLQSQVKEDRVSNDEIEQRKLGLYNELNGIHDKIRERQKQLATARQQLQDVADQRVQLENHLAMLKKSNPLLLKKPGEKTFRQMQSLIWKELMTYGAGLLQNVLDVSDEWNYVRKVNYLAPIERSNMAPLLEYGNLIVEIATKIYVGDLTAANSLATKNGWRQTKLEREKPYDNGQFLEQCFNEALDMVTK